jgi:Uri superfamily endonuclease
MGAQIEMRALPVLDSQPGTYALVLSSAGNGTIRVGRLGELALRPGFYVYVGSAFGPGGLRARITRHMKRVKRLRWHVDYLRAVSEPMEAWFTSEPNRRECEWAEALRLMPGAEVPLAGFGSSDCRCRSHLFFFRRRPTVSAFGKRVRIGFGHPICSVYLAQAHDRSIEKR